ncbi:hypothetical protein [Nannocystis bainbridge]|uniref:Dodecin domain-containing protein n=1 Tax=Nannocystis bainbridge TaxID=2995303 RepID=A0ABT5E4A4_9BACT|nr:hypothetical protein [Nannocystis bainbridge]MDC0720694.1 hypothetical protein [Nannocystis bainbridge]
MTCPKYHVRISGHAEEIEIDAASPEEAAEEAADRVGASASLTAFVYAPSGEVLRYRVRSLLVFIYEADLLP